MPSLRDLLGDPAFLGLPEIERQRVFNMAASSDADFQGLPPMERQRLRQMVVHQQGASQQVAAGPESFGRTETGERAGPDLWEPAAAVLHPPLAAIPSGEKLGGEALKGLARGVPETAGSLLRAGERAATGLLMAPYQIPGAANAAIGGGRMAWEAKHRVETGEPTWLTKIEDLAQKPREAARAVEKLAEKAPAAEVPEFTGVRSYDDFVKWFGGVLGEQAPIMGAIAGSAVAGPAGPLLTGMALETGAIAKEEEQERGGIPQTEGVPLLERIEKGQEASPWASLAGGVVAGSLESLPIYGLLNRSPVAKNLNQFVRKKLRGVGAQMLEEGGTEALQTFVERAALDFAAKNRGDLENVKLTTREGIAETAWDAVNAAAAGMAVGGVMGTASPVQAQIEERPTEAPPAGPEAVAAPEPTPAPETTPIRRTEWAPEEENAARAQAAPRWLTDPATREEWARGELSNEEVLTRTEEDPTRFDLLEGVEREQVLADLDESSNNARHFLLTGTFPTPAAPSEEAGLGVEPEATSVVPQAAVQSAAVIPPTIPTQPAPSPEVAAEPGPAVQDEQWAAPTLEGVRQVVKKAAARARGRGDNARADQLERANVRQVEGPAEDQSQRFLDHFVQTRGWRPVWFESDTDVPVLGAYVEPGVIALGRNQSVAKQVAGVAFHEMFHGLKDANPQLYRELISVVKEAAPNAVIRARQTALKRQQAGLGETLTGEALEDETFAYLASEQGDAILGAISTKLGVPQKTIARKRLASWLHDLMVKLGRGVGWEIGKGDLHSELREVAEHYANALTEMGAPPTEAAGPARAQPALTSIITKGEYYEGLREENLTPKEQKVLYDAIAVAEKEAKELVWETYGEPMSAERQVQMAPWIQKRTGDLTLTKKLDLKKAALRKGPPTKKIPHIVGYRQPGATTTKAIGVMSLTPTDAFVRAQEKLGDEPKIVGVVRKDQEKKAATPAAKTDVGKEVGKEKAPARKAPERQVGKTPPRTVERGDIKLQLADDADGYPSGTLTPESVWKSLRRWTVQKMVNTQFQHAQTFEELAGATIEERVDSVTAAGNLTSRTKRRLERHLRQFVTPIKEAIAKHDLSLEDVGGYAYALHAPERNARIYRDAVTRPIERIRGAISRHQGVKGKRADKLRGRIEQHEERIAELKEQQAQAEEQYEDELKERRKKAEMLTKEHDRRIELNKVKRLEAQEAPRVKSLRSTRKGERKAVETLKRKVGATEKDDAKVRALRDKIAEIEKTADKHKKGSGISDTQAAKMLEDLRERGLVSWVGDDPATRRYSGPLAEVQRLVAKATEAKLKVLEEYGLEDPEMLDRWRNYKYYVPLKGKEGGIMESIWGWDYDAEADKSGITKFAEGLGAKMIPKAERHAATGGKGMSVKGPSSKRALGRKEAAEAAAILPNLVVDLQEAVVRGEKNRVMRKFLDFVQEHIDAKNADGTALWEVDKVVYKRQFDEKTGVIRLVKDTQHRNEANVAHVRVNGVDYDITINHGRLASSINNLGAVSVGPIVKYLVMANRYLSQIHTSWNPDFIVPNLFRDVQAAAINLSREDVEAMVGETLKRVPRLISAIYKAERGERVGKDVLETEWSQWYDEYRDSGGKVEFWMIPTVETTYKQMEKEIRAGKKGGRKLAEGAMYALHQLEDVNTGIENAVRLSTYISSRKRGVSKAQAARLARRVTVDFNQRGEWAGAMAGLYLFANATIQGGAIMYDTMLKSPRARKIAAGMAGMGALWGAAARMAMCVDPDDGIAYYDKIPLHVRERNIIVPKFPCGGGYFKIPLPYGYNLPFVFGETVASVAQNGVTPMEGAAHMVGAMMGAFNPLGEANLADDFLKGSIQQVTPAVVKPVVDIAMNRNFFGAPLRPEQRGFAQHERYGKTPDSERYFSSVSAPSRFLTWLANKATGGDKYNPGMLDVSPENLDYLISAITGGSGRFLRDFVSMPVKGAMGKKISTREKPIYRRFAGEQSEYFAPDMFYAHAHSVYTRSKMADELKKEDPDQYSAYMDRWGWLISLKPEVQRLEKELRKAKEAGADKRRLAIMKRFNRLYFERERDNK